jgi:N-acetylglucosaminyl-diphospho-decaprenol L-rhamnosyltransferase
MKIDIIIVNWNTGDYLKKCVESLIKYDNNNIGQIIIVDNNSSDQSVNSLEHNKLIKIIKGKKNNGFGKACNIGAKYSQEKYLLFLNPDTRVFTNTIKHSLEFMEKGQNSKIAISGAQMVNNDGNIIKSCSYFPTASRFFFNSIGLDNLFKNKGLLMKDFDHRESIYVNQVIGAFFLIRRDVFFKLNGFDERFFLYFEEVDLSLRSFQLGYLSYFNSNIRCFHRGGISSNNDKVNRHLNYLKSKIIYAKKHFSIFNFQLTVFTTVIIEFIARFFYSLLKISINELKILTVSYYQFITWFFRKN